MSPMLAHSYLLPDLPTYPILNAFRVQTAQDKAQENKIQ